MSRNNIQVRVLNETHADAYKSLRLRALVEHPEAYGTSTEEAPDDIARHIETLRRAPPDNPTFGAFEGEQMVGIVQLIRYSRLKTRHRALIASMYVTPEARRQGAARLLLDAAIQHGKTLEGLEEIILAVTVGNEGARALYINAGFIPYSIEPRYLKIGDTYYDMEWMSLRL